MTRPGTASRRPNAMPARAHKQRSSTQKVRTATAESTVLDLKADPTTDPSYEKRKAEALSSTASIQLPSRRE